MAYNISELLFNLCMLWELGSLFSLHNIFFALLNGSSLFHRCGMDLAYPDQPLLKAKQLFVMDNLLRKKRFSGIVHIYAMNCCII